MQHNHKIDEYRSTLGDLDRLLAEGSDRTVFIDFDYTLFRSNSTEEFINCGRPITVSRLLLGLLKALHPWGFGPQQQGRPLWRDAIRVWAILLCMPWTLWLFNRKAPALFAQLGNRELMAIIDRVPTKDIVIISVGFEWLIRVLLRRSPLQGARVIGSSFLRPLELRRVGKLARLRQSGDAPRFERDVVVTDSLDDRDLLDSVEAGYLIEPRDDSTTRDDSNVYLPFLYTAKVKRSVGFVVKQMFAEELVVVLLATVLFHSFSPAIWLSAICLFVAYLIAYEIGYAENDRQGALRELNPKLGVNFERFRGFKLEPAAWFWVTGFTLAGVMLLGADVVSAVLTRIGLPLNEVGVVNALLLGGVWILLILVGRTLFYVYNRLPMVWRIFGYFPLHVSKYFSLIIIFPSQAVGYALLCAQIARTWSLYAIRRAGGDIEVMPSQSIRLAFLLLFLFSMELYLPDQGVFLQWQTLVILGWCVVRAAPEARRKLFSASALAAGMRLPPDAVPKDMEH